MFAYKGFNPGMVCLGYQFVMGMNVTDKANCRQNGFHCAENPLDCLSYYGDMKRSEYYLVRPGGDMDEDEIDSKIACTELEIIKRLDREEFLLHALAYMMDHPKRKCNSHVARDQASASCGFAIVRGIDPIAKGKKGDILAFAKEDARTGKITQIALNHVDDKKLKSGVWYDIDLNTRKAA